jgi:hypothetical protein
MQHIKDTLNVNFCSYSKGDSNQVLIYSSELYNYLTTFFKYKKISKIHPPLTSDVKTWYDQGIDLKNALICPLLQTDGTIDQQKYMLKFYGLNKVLHDYFVDAIYYEYNELPSSYFVYNDSSSDYFTVYSQKTAIELIDDIMKRAGNSKTAPSRGQPIEDYLKEPQPHLNYLTNSTEAEQKIALRIWASAEGHIMIYQSSKYIYPSLSIACAHPTLLNQLKQIAKRFDIRLAERKSKKIWSGFSGLSGNSIKNLIAFLKLGGFIKQVKISSSSPYHEGIDKDILTLGILEFKKRRKTISKLKKLPIKKAHYEVNKIIKNKEYRTTDYYVNIFSYG